MEKTGKDNDNMDPVSGEEVARDAAVKKQKTKKERQTEGRHGQQGVASGATAEGGKIRDAVALDAVATKVRAARATARLNGPPNEGAIVKEETREDIRLLHTRTCHLGRCVVKVWRPSQPST